MEQRTIAELQKEVEELKRERDMVVQASAAKSRFLSSVSHDLRTPINGIMGMLEMAKKNKYNYEMLSECLNKIGQASNHLLSLIDDILDISRMVSDDFEPDDQPFDVREVMGDCVSIIRPVAEGGQVELVLTDIGELTHPYVRGNALSLRKVFLNLMSNAIKYNKIDGRLVVSVEELSASDGAVELQWTFADTGIGMSREFQQYMLEPFMRECAEGCTAEGTGLGLSIVMRAVESMGGTLMCESVQGEGSTFVVTIPFELCSEEEIAVLSGTKPKGETVPDITGVRVMLVDDDSMNIEFVEYILTEAGAVIAKARNGREAVELFTSNAPGTFDVILTDVMMPEMTGIQATRKIRSLVGAEAKHIPIIAMTANAFPEDVEACLSAGMNQHITKPLSAATVIRAIGQALS